MLPCWWTGTKLNRLRGFRGLAAAMTLDVTPVVIPADQIVGPDRDAGFLSRRSYLSSERTPGKEPRGSATCQWASKMSHFWALKMSHVLGVSRTGEA